MAKKSTKRQNEKQRLEKIRSEVAKELNIDIEEQKQTKSSTAKLVRELLGEISPKENINDEGE